jgi:hypothetical protein
MRLGIIEDNVLTPDGWAGGIETGDRERQTDKFMGEKGRGE